MATKKKALKKSKLRHAEYYDFQKNQDKLYAESMDGKMFTKLVEIITLPENIKLAYRNMNWTGGWQANGKTFQHNIRSSKRLTAMAAPIMVISMRPCVEAD